jgi:hypothetical protein
MVIFWGATHITIIRYWLLCHNFEILFKLRLHLFMKVMFVKLTIVNMIRVVMQDHIYMYACMYIWDCIGSF